MLRSILHTMYKIPFSVGSKLGGQEAIPIQITLEEMGHSQTLTPVQVDDSTALVIATRTIKQRNSKAIYMRFYWIRDRKNQDKFNIYWKPGSTNRGDYFTKYFLPAHHSTVHPSYLHVAKFGKHRTLQGRGNLALSVNHPVHPCAPTKFSAHAYTQNCAHIHRESP